MLDYDHYSTISVTVQFLMLGTCQKLIYNVYDGACIHATINIYIDIKTLYKIYIRQQIGCIHIYSYNSWFRFQKRGKLNSCLVLFTAVNESPHPRNPVYCSLPSRKAKPCLLQPSWKGSSRTCCDNTEDEGVASHSESSVWPVFKSRPATEPRNRQRPPTAAVAVGRLGWFDGSALFVEKNHYMCVYYITTVVNVTSL